MPTFFWYDYETFGKQPRCDRPAQFAGIRTDMNLEPIGEPSVLYCKPSPDFLPDPESCLITGITPQHCRQHGVSEREFADRILKELAKPGTIAVGFNSIKFDDEMTRFLFWRNLIPPYDREWQNNCSRWDLLNVARTCWALRPEGIHWPKYRDGENSAKPSFKLEDLCRENGLKHESAHDALSDVRATIALAKLIKEKQPKLWAYCLEFRSKQELKKRLNGYFLHQSATAYPADKGYLSIVQRLAALYGGSEIIVWDLTHDPSVLKGLDAETVRRRLFSKSEALKATGETRLPIKTIKLKQCPFVCENKSSIENAAKRWSIDLDLVRKNAEKIPEVINSLNGLWAEVYTKPSPHSDPEQDLYSGLPEEVGQPLIAQNRQNPQNLAELERIGFQDPRLPELVFRYRARNFPETFSPAETERWRVHCRGNVIDGKNERMSVSAFRDKIIQLESEHTETPPKMKILSDLREYAKSLEQTLNSPVG